MTAAALAVVIVNFGSSRLLRNLAPDAPDSRVVIVDNFATDAERAAVGELSRERGWDLVASDTNRGFGGGANLGARHAIATGATQLLFLNPDAEIDEAGISALRTALAEHPHAMVAPVILRGDGTVWFEGGRLLSWAGVADHARGRRDISEWLTGACLAMTADTWERSGGFDEDYFLYWEDVDLTHRWRSGGGQLLVVSTATAHHDEGGTQQAGTLRRSPTYVRYMVRGRRLFAQRNLGPALRLWWAITGPAYVAHLARIAGLLRHPFSRTGFWSPALRGLTESLPRGATRR